MLIGHPTEALRICYDSPTKSIQVMLSYNGTIISHLIMLGCEEYFMHMERDLYQWQSIMKPLHLN